MALSIALQPFKGDYSKLFTPGHVLKLNMGKGWVISQRVPSTREHKVFFTQLAADLADLSKEEMSNIPEKISLIRRVNEVWHQAVPVENNDPIYFSSKSESNYFLSNFYSTLIVFQDRVFPSSEHLYQWSLTRLVDPDTDHWAAMKDLTPLNSKKYSRNLQDRFGPVRPIEDKEKLEVMDTVSKAKYEQNKDLQEGLAKTAPCRLIEDTESSFWGRGNDGKGENHLGHILERIRQDQENGTSCDSTSKV